MSRKEIQVEEKLPLLQTLPLSLQHLFAMFGASVLVPMLVGVSPAVQLLFNGAGTLIYILITKGKIPAFLGPSAAFITVIATVMGSQGYGAAMGGCIAVGVIFIIGGLVVSKVGMGWVDVVLPPAAMGSIVAVIGLSLARLAVSLSGLMPGAVEEALVAPTVRTALFTLTVAILANVLLKGFMGIIPILIAVVAGYLFSITQGLVDFTTVAEAKWIALPAFVAPKFSLTAILTIAPAALVVLTEHIGDLTVTEKIVNRKLIRKEGGLARSYMGNGIGTCIAGCFGAMPVTTYGENIAVMALSGVYSVWVIGGAAILSVLLAFCGKVNAVIMAMPTAVMGGVSILLFGTIAASGLRMLVESRVDFGKRRNLILSAVILIMGIGGAQITIGTVTLEGMALATIAGIVLSLVFKLFDTLRISNESEYHKK